MTQYFERQLDILPPSALVYPLTCIGLGGIGSNVMYYARKMGFSHLVLWDPDTVESLNLPAQHFSESSLGRKKTEACADDCKNSLDSPLSVTVHTEQYCKNKPLEGVVVGAVDSMTSRQEIWDGVLKNRAFIPLYIDGRIGVLWDQELGKVTGEFIEVFTLVPSKIEDQELYAQHLFADEERAPDRCTAQAVAYIGAFIAGFICAKLRKWITKEPYYRYILYDCLTNKMLIATM